MGTPCGDMWLHQRPWRRDIGKKYEGQHGSEGKVLKDTEMPGSHQIVHPNKQLSIQSLRLFFTE
jgi:hypothetical protein